MSTTVPQEYAKLVDENGYAVALSIINKVHVNAFKKYLEAATSADVIKLVTKLLKRKKRFFR